MDDEKKNGKQEDGKGEAPGKEKNGWYKAEVLSKFLTAILVVIIGFWGNQYLQQKQKNDSDLKLYTQLLSNKETAENTLRKDMFVKILDSFLQSRGDKTAGEETALRNIKAMRLNLELLSRNFHESMDMKPLFKHLLMAIIEPRIKLKRLLTKLENCPPGSEENSCDQRAIENLTGEVEKLTNEELVKAQSINKDDRPVVIRKVRHLLARYDEELESLVKAAKRVTRKQRDILEDVSGLLRLTVDLTGEEAKKVCTEYTPQDWLPEDGKCENKHHNWEDEQSAETNAVRKVDGVETHGNLSFRNENGEEDPDSTRFFLMRVRYLYPMWKQAYVEILTCPAKDGEAITEEICEERHRNDPDINIKSSFWLEYFDFPLVDNTYINSTQRYSVILEGFKADENDRDENAKITLLYYPSSYSGLKEKSFYDTQLMRTLLKSNLFKKDKI